MYSIPQQVKSNVLKLFVKCEIEIYDMPKAKFWRLVFRNKDVKKTFSATNLKVKSDMDRVAKSRTVQSADAELGKYSLRLVVICFLQRG